MKITIIGGGSVGKALGEGWARNDHEIVFGVRDPDKGGFPEGTHAVGVSSSTQGSDVVVLAVPYWKTDEVLDALDLGDLKGKIILDVRNPLTPEKQWAVGFSTSAAEDLQKRLPDSKVVKAINTVFSDTMDGGRRNGETLNSFVAADDEQAKAVGMKLSRDLGLEAIDAGGLAAARYVEALGAFEVHLGANTSTGWDIGLRLVQGKPG